MLKKIFIIIMFSGSTFATEPEHWQNIELRSHNNEALRISDYKGIPILLTFSYARCLVYCPTQNFSIKRLYNKLKDGGYSEDDYKIISISMKPETESPKDLKDYMKDFNLENLNWTFATGEVDNVKKLIDIFDVKITNFNTTDQINHTTNVFVIDKEQIGFKSIPSIPFDIESTYHIVTENINKIANKTK